MLVPQSGGLVAEGHRCPGEDTTPGTVAASAAHLAALTWHLPAQALTVDWRRMPTRPGRGVRAVLDTA